VIISSMVLFLRRAICGVGPDVEADRFGVEPVGAERPAVVDDPAAAVDPPDVAVAQKRPEVEGAAVDVGAAVVEEAAVVDVPENRPPADGAAGADDEGALVVAVLDGPKRPLDGGADGFDAFEEKRPPKGGAEVVVLDAGADVLAVADPKRPPTAGVELGAVGALAAADGALVADAPVNKPDVGVEEVALDVEEDDPKRPPEIGFVFAPGAKSPPLDDEGALLDVLAEPNSGVEAGADAVVAAGAEPKSPVEDGADVVAAAGAEPKSPPDGVVVVVFVEGVEPKRPPVEGVGLGLAEDPAEKRPPVAGVLAVFAAGADPNSPPDGADVVPDEGALPNKPAEVGADV
jgi:hypothetical protein